MSESRYKKLLEFNCHQPLNLYVLSFNLGAASPILYRGTIFYLIFVFKAEKSKYKS